MSGLADRTVVLGVTGGIAAYKSCELVRRLRDEGATVQVVMTAAAQQFVSALTFQALSGRPVATDLWQSDFANGMPHIELTRNAAALLIAPATADFIARLAQGRADDLLGSTVLARRPGCPVLIAPAMNVEMWQQAATRRNVARVVDDGAYLLGPAQGEQACGDEGDGRMLEPADIIQDLIAALSPKPLAGLRVLITAGPTVEPIDPVRAITNHSSGKMGYAIARAAREAGAEVTLVSGPTPLATPRGVLRIDVQTAVQMQAAVLSRVDDAQVFIAVAAVADWRVANPRREKIKKEGAAAPNIEFAANPDILAEVAARPRAPYCVGFAAESENLLANAQGKLARKKAALIVANLAQDSFGRDEAELVLVDRQGETRLPRAGKLEQARRLVATLAQRLPEKLRTPPAGDAR